jgi:ribosome modulation factor
MADFDDQTSVLDAQQTGYDMYEAGLSVSDACPFEDDHLVNAFCDGWLMAHDHEIENNQDD